jgi:hypothetical protein
MMTLALFVVNVRPVSVVTALGLLRIRWGACGFRV